jgi:heme-degrading monooxygenase HmoA
MARPAATPKPPYFAVVFTSLRTELAGGYDETAAHMEELAAAQPGYLGVESARGADGLGITVSYWESEGAIRAWKAQVDHAQAQRRGRADWYQAYRVRVARVEREYGFGAPAREDGT